MSQIVKHNQPCLNPECGSHDGMQIYDTGTAFCFSCRKWFKPEDISNMAMTVSSPIPKSSPRKLEFQLKEISEFPIRGFEDRKITKEVTEFFKVRVSYGEDGEISSHYYPYDEGKAYKVRGLPKTFSWVGNSSGLFGKEHFAPGGKRLIICEGEIDAMSVAQASIDKYRKIYPVVALSSSAMAKKSLLAEREWIRSFKEVIWCGDEDEAGYKARAEAIPIIGIDKIKLVKLPKNDANQVYLECGSLALNIAIWEAVPYVPAGIINKVDLRERLINRAKIPSVPYPDCLAGVNAKTKGHRGGEIVLFTSGTGCFGIDTEVLMFDGSMKKVQDIIVGDILMGDDNTPRNVLQLYRGEENMNRIELRDGSNFICNDSHVLSLVNNDKEGRWGLTQNEVVDVKLSTYNDWSLKRKHLTKAFKASMLEFPSEKIESLHPYILGVWLGDGNSDGAIISTQISDFEIIQKLRDNELFIYKGASKFAWNSPGGLRKQLQDLGVFGNKHIPEQYLTAMAEDRLELLAGLLDTDGSYDLAKNMYEFSQKSHEFIKQVDRLACSLGFTTSLNIQKNNKFGNCWRLWISGEHLEDIPCALPRKKARVRKQIKNPHRYSFTVTPLGVGNYYGFEVDENNRFVLGNFIVTHNSGKSSLLREDILHILKTTEDKIGIVSLEESPEETAQKLAGMVLMKNPSNEEIPEEELLRGYDEVFDSDRIVLLDHQGSINDNSIIDQLEYMCLMGCKYLYIDHITILVSEGADNLSGNEAIDKVMNDLLRLVKRHTDVWIGLVSHLRKVQTGGKSFEEGKIPTLDDVKGSGSIKQISFDVIGFARNLTAIDPIERNTILMSVLKSRHTGLTGPVPGAIYNNETGRLRKAGQDQFTEI